MTADVRAYWLLDALAIVRVSGDETGGRFCVVEFLQPPGDMTPLHVHRDESQTIHVLEGELTVWTGPEKRVLGPGQSVHQAAGTPQTERAETQVRLVDVNSPAGFDRFVAGAGRPAEALALPPPAEEEPDFDRIAAAAAEHGIEVLGPPGALPEG